MYAAEKKEIAVSVDCPEAVSYTHLDVYKRQILNEVSTWDKIVVVMKMGEQ